MLIDNAPVPMYVITPEGAEKMEGLRHALDNRLITPGEFERAVMNVRRDHSPSVAYRPKCLMCDGRSSWRCLQNTLPVSDGPSVWDYLCIGCAADLMNMEGVKGQPWVMQPLGDGVYDPDVVTVMRAHRERTLGF